MRNSILLFFTFGLLFSGCSTSSIEENAANSQPINYFYLKVNGSDANAYSNGNNLIGPGGIKINKGVITIAVNFGEGFEWHVLNLAFTKEGKLISAQQDSHSAENGSWSYFNHRDFPSNFFNISVSLNETSNRITIKFKGKLYLDKNNLNSEFNVIEGDISSDYYIEDDINPNYLITSSDSYGFSMEQYCTSNIDNLLWIARHEHVNSAFTSVDPYKIELHFDINASPGSFILNSTNAINYLRFSKFNTTTLTYDYYNVTGTLAYSYREYHGFTYYSYIGTFDFTAVNPNNPSDIINVTNGKFRSFQQF